MSCLRLNIKAIFALLLTSLPPALAIWPAPIKFEHGDKTVIFFDEDRVKVEREGWEGPCMRPTPLVSNPLQKLLNYVSPDMRSSYSAKSILDEEGSVQWEEVVDYAWEQAKTTISKKSFVPWKFHDRGWVEPESTEAIYLSLIIEEQLKPDPPNAGKPLAGEVDESYRLTLDKEGQAHIWANSSTGFARAYITFSQLFFAHSEGGAYTPYAPLEIFDAPRFQHRGMNLDIARQWYSVEDIKRTIDAAAYNKMNRFHLHVTDSQSWPLEIPSLPNLAKKGAYRPELTYSPSDFRSLQRHAALQGVELITEIDMPGHTSSIWFSEPDLILAFNKEPWDEYAAEPPAGTLKLNSSAVDTFLETLLDDLLPRISPYSAYFHTGGDEVNRNAYGLDDDFNPTGLSDDASGEISHEKLRPYMQKFIDAIHAHVRRMGLTPIVWEEMLLEWDLTLGSDVVVQSWLGDGSVEKIVSKGYKAIVGNYMHWYLDCGKGQWLSTPRSKYPYTDYCAPFHNWREMYSYDPLSGIPPEHHHLVIGGETHMWSEQTDPMNLDQMVWPRAAAVAEVLWSGATDEQGRNRSFVDVSRRLAEMRERLVALGVRAEPVVMPFCTMGGDMCVLGEEKEE